jgi:hypothetical protein
MVDHTRPLIAGNLGGTNVGDSLLQAAKEIGLSVQFVETGHAQTGPRLWRAFNWRVLSHRPSAQAPVRPMGEISVVSLEYCHLRFSWGFVQVGTPNSLEKRPLATIQGHHRNIHERERIHGRYVTRFSRRRALNIEYGFAKAKLRVRRERQFN